MTTYRPPDDWKPAVPAEEFAQEYAERSGMTLDGLRAYNERWGRDVRPCVVCDDPECQGWQMVKIELWEDDQRMRGWSTKWP